jgi:hypothetical protein
VEPELLPRKAVPVELQRRIPSHQVLLLTTSTTRSSELTGIPLTPPNVDSVHADQDQGEDRNHFRDDAKGDFGGHRSREEGVGDKEVAEAVDEPD